MGMDSEASNPGSVRWDPSGIIEKKIFPFLIDEIEGKVLQTI